MNKSNWVEKGWERALKESFKIRTNTYQTLHYQSFWWWWWFWLLRGWKGRWGRIKEYQWSISRSWKWRCWNSNCSWSWSWSCSDFFKGWFIRRWRRGFERFWYIKWLTWSRHDLRYDWDIHQRAWWIFGF